MSALVFVDTNVFLYKCDATHPAKQRRSVEWISFLWRERTGRTSMQVLSEFYFNATRKLKPGLPKDEAWDEVLAYLTWQPLPIDVGVLKAAKEIERRYRLSWWDSTVVAAAQECDAQLLVVRGRRHHRTRSLPLGSVTRGVLRHATCPVAVVQAS